MTLHLLGATSIGADIFVAPTPEKFLGKVWSSPEGQHPGQCVSLVRSATGAPHSSSWTAGDPVKGNSSIAPGTAIATFQDGKYGNHTDGRSHGAVYMSQDDAGIYVIDQWTGQPGHARHIRFKGGKPNAEPAPGAAAPHNDGDAFSVVVAGTSSAVGYSRGYRVGDALPSNEGGSQAEVLAKMKAAEKPASFLGTKTGPLKNWQWGVVGVGGAGAYMYRGAIADFFRKIFG